MGWMNERWLAFDLESNGLNHEIDRIATAAAVIMRAGEVEFKREWVIDVDMPDEASRINKLTTEWLHANGRPAADVIPEIVKALRYAVQSRMPIVAYNGVFDFSFTDREARRHMGSNLESLLGAPVFPVLDPFVCWKEVVRKKRGKRQLVDACAAFDVELGEDAHEAAPDAIAAARVMFAIGKKFPRIARMSLPELHAAQIVWRREQCDSLRAYFEEAGKEHDGVPVEWPMLPYVEMAVAA